MDAPTSLDGSGPDGELTAASAATASRSRLRCRAATCPTDEGRHGRIRTSLSLLLLSLAAYFVGRARAAAASSRRPVASSIRSRTITAPLSPPGSACRRSSSCSLARAAGAGHRPLAPVRACRRMTDGARRAQLSLLAARDQERRRRPNSSASRRRSSGGGRALSSLAGDRPLGRWSPRRSASCSSALSSRERSSPRASARATVSSACSSVFMIVCSVVAILTTHRHHRSLLFEALRFFGRVSPYRVLLRPALGAADRHPRRPGRAPPAPSARCRSSPARC